MMNKRIRELAKEAEAYADYYAFIADEPEKDIFVRRFAELIIEECAAICDTEADEFGGMSDGFYAAKNCAEAIRARGGDA